MTNKQAILISLVLFVLVAMGLLWDTSSKQEDEPAPAIVVDEQEREEGNGGQGQAGIGPLELYRRTAALLALTEQYQRAFQRAAEDFAKVRLDLSSVEMPPPLPDPNPLRWEQGRAILVFLNGDQYHVKQTAAQLSLSGENVFCLTAKQYPKMFEKFQIKMVPRYVVLQDGQVQSTTLTPPAIEE